jgi:3-oxoacyl-[acyl-carrier protein] reductase
MSRRKNNEVENIYCDVESYESVKDSFSFCVEKFEKPEILVYSAGFVEPQGLLEIEPEIWQKQINVNLTGAFYTTQQFAKACDKSLDNRIIYISSTASLRSSPAWSAYASAKSGLNEFANCMSSELKPYVKIYCISLGRCNTQLRDKLNNTEDKSVIMQPFQVALVVENLINDKYSLLDGQNIVVRKLVE